MACFLGTYWCCNTADLAAQHRLFRSLLALHIMQTLGILWLCAWSFSIAVGSDCLAVEEPAVVIIALLVLLTFAATFLTALAHDVALSLFALPFFPVIAGDRGRRLELAARFGVTSQIPRLLRAAKDDDDGVAALCQAAEAGHVAVIHALVDAGVSTAAKWRGQSALHWAARGGQRQHHPGTAIVWRKRFGTGDGQRRDCGYACGRKRPLGGGEISSHCRM